jgi:hypothetical protein
MLGYSVSRFSALLKLYTMGNGRKQSKQWHVWQPSINGKVSSGMEVFCSSVNISIL